MNCNKLDAFDSISSFCVQKPFSTDLEVLSVASTRIIFRLGQELGRGFESRHKARKFNKMNSFLINFVTYRSGDYENSLKKYQEALNIERNLHSKLDQSSIKIGLGIKLLFLKS